MVSRLGIVVPVYNHPHTIEAIVTDLLELTPYPIWVIDDGSDCPVTMKDPRAVSALASQRLCVVRHLTNLGKGTALQAAFNIALKEGLTHLLSIDADGQHPPHEIIPLIQASLANPHAIVIGSRRMPRSSPSLSRFGKIFSNFWVRYETSRTIQDSQSGLRIYPLFFLQNQHFFCSRYDFEIEVLIRLMWKGVEVVEVPVDVVYLDKESRVSHFRKLHDNARISLLNAILVVLSLLRSHRKPVELALALGIGVFIGCSPFFGFHTPIAIGTALLFRLNFIVLWLGTQISIPPIAPFLAFFSIRLGGGSIDSASSAIELAKTLPLQWLRGSLLLGLLLGGLAGILAYFASSYLRRPKKAWTGKSRGGFVGNLFLSQLTRYFGVRPAYAALYFIVPYFYFFAPRATLASNQYWKTLNPDFSFWKRQWHVLKHYYRFGQCLLDRLFQSHRNTPQFQIHSSGFDAILQALEEKKGALLLTAHVGGFDIAARFVETHGASATLHPVQFEASGLTFSKIKSAEEKARPQALIVNQGSLNILKIKEVLGQNRVVGLMVDRPMTEHFELVPFLGKLAAFDTTPFRIAMATAAPMLFSSGFKGQENEYEFIATRMSPPANDLDRALACYQWILEYKNLLETQVRKHPDQWFNFFPFWSVIPGEAKTPVTGHSPLLHRTYGSLPQQDL